MGTVCHHSKVPLIPISFPQEKESIPNIITTTQVTQSHFSQNLDDFSATLRSNPFRISILKEDIKLVYKFKKNIGKITNNSPFFMCFHSVFYVFLEISYFLSLFCRKFLRFF